MKKLSLMAAILFATSTFAIDKFPNGTFKGMGYWKSPKGTKGDYTAELHIQDEAVTATVTLADGTTFQNKYVVEYNEHGFFVLKTKIDGKEVPAGHGYCGSVWCHLGSQNAQGKYEETVAFIDGKIYRLGSAIGPEGAFMWEDSLN